MKTKKKKPGRGLLWAVLALVLLLAAYFVMDRAEKKEEEAETEETESSLPVSVTEEELAGVTVKNHGETMTFVKGEEGWTYEEDRQFPLDETALQTKLNQLAGLSVERTLESPEDLSEYGLDAPTLEITVKKSDDTSFSLSIGDKNSGTGDYYMKVDEGTDVYTIAGTIPGSFDMTPYDVAEAEDFPAPEAADLREIEVEKDGKTLAFTTGNTGISWTLKGADGSESLADSTAMETLTSAAAGLSYQEFVDYKGTELEKYGLDKPAAKITVVTEETEAETEESEMEEESVTETETEESETGTESVTEAETGESETGTESVTEAEAAESETETETETEEPKTVERTTVLLVGDTNEDGDYYVKLPDNPEVHTMSASALETLLNIQETDYVSTYLNDVPMTDLKSLEVTYQGETRTPVGRSQEER